MDFDTTMSETAKAKERLFYANFQTDAQESALLHSWKRSHEALGSPENIAMAPHVPAEMLDEHLLEVFGPLMSRFADNVQGTGLALLLADARGQIVQRWFEDRRAEAHLDTVGTVRGAVLAENVVGTNGVGTVLALGRPVQVSGPQHYAEFYQGAVCTGAPIMHPTSGNILAVLTISCDLTPGADYLKPLVRSMSREMQEHLVRIERPDSRQMLNLFLTMSKQTGSPIVGFGAEGAIMRSSEGQQIPEPDIEVLRQFSQEEPDSGSYIVELSSGLTELDYHAIGNQHRLVRLMGPAVRATTPANRPIRPRNLVGRSPEWLALVSQLNKLRNTEFPVIIAGEYGTGKASLALDHPYHFGDKPAEMELLEAGEANVLGNREWFSQAREIVNQGKPVVIRGIEALDDAGLNSLRLVLSGTTNRNIIMTLTTEEPSDAGKLELLLEANSVWLPPLRDRIVDLPDLWTNLVAANGGGSQLELGSQALNILSIYDWPGNIRELSRLIRQIINAGKSGVVTPADLPGTMQMGKNLSLIERVEIEAIKKALAEANGNRSKASEILGVSRATVYRKIKTYALG
ncbi:RocR-like transcription regulator [Pontimonas salivibrio]|uniref:RocR-like transcription regulator n=2 Tax=Pontimonas salivibrio TaxID=1159327 RepID=A0A2L2BRK4_9MICO|nr:RocR-like transcription regulator [Pontimonas salivibrio]